MALSVKPVHVRSVLWTLGFVRYTWAPLTLSIVGQWVVSLLQIGAVTLVAFAVAQLGESADQPAPVLPELVRDWFPPGADSAMRATAIALALVLGAGIMDTIVAFAATWMHVILNRRLTPAAIRRSLTCQVDHEQNIDPSTCVQRWLLKAEIVEFFHNGVANILGSVGTIIIVLVVTFSASYTAGWVLVASLGVWGIICVFLTRRALVASRVAASEHEVMGRMIRASVALRHDMSRPSFLRFWLGRAEPETARLGKAIFWQGYWGSLLFGVLGTIAEAVPVLALLAAVSSSGLQGSLAVYLYVSRVVSPLGNLSRLLPMLQSQLISIQRVFDAFSGHLHLSTLDGERYSTVGELSLHSAEVRHSPAAPSLSFPELRVAQGEILCVVGPSGSGKSTLLSALSGQRRFSMGELRVDGQVVDPTSPKWRETCCLLPQEPELLPGQLGDNLDSFPGWTQTEEMAIAVEAVTKGTVAGKATGVGVEVPAVSAGQRRAVALLRALGTDAGVLLLDEPIAGLDQGLVNVMKAAIDAAARQGRIIILALHVHDFERLGFHHSKAIHLGLSS